MSVRSCRTSPAAAASDRSPPARKASSRTRSSPAAAQQSMKPNPARSTTMRRPLPATALNDATNSSVFTASSSPHNPTTTRSPYSRLRNSTLAMRKRLPGPVPGRGLDPTAKRHDPAHTLPRHAATTNQAKTPEILARTFPPTDCHRPLSEYGTRKATGRGDVSTGVATGTCHAIANTARPALWPGSGLDRVVRAAGCQITYGCGRESGCICRVSSRTWFRAEIAAEGASGKTGAFDEPGRVRCL